MGKTFERQPDGSYLLSRGVYAYRSGRRWVVLTTDDGLRFETADPDGGAYTGGEKTVLDWAHGWGRKYRTLADAAASIG